MCFGLDASNAYIRFLSCRLVYPLWEIKASEQKLEVWKDKILVLEGSEANNLESPLKRT